MICADLPPALRALKVHDKRRPMIVPQVLSIQLAVSLVVPPTMVELFVVLAYEIFEVGSRTLVRQKLVQLVE